MERRRFGRLGKWTLLGSLATALAVLTAGLPGTAQAAGPMVYCGGDPAYAKAPGFSETVFDDTSTWITYAGTWRTINDDPSAINSTIHFARFPGPDTATLWFYGNAVTVYYRTAPGQGGMGVYVDDQSVGTFSQNTQSRRYLHRTYCDQQNGPRWHKVVLLDLQNDEEDEYHTTLDALQIHQYIYA